MDSEPIKRGPRRSGRKKRKIMTSFESRRDERPSFTQVVVLFGLGLLFIWMFLYFVVLAIRFR